MSPNIVNFVSYFDLLSIFSVSLRNFVLIGGTEHVTEFGLVAVVMGQSNPQTETLFRFLLVFPVANPPFALVRTRSDPPTKDVATGLATATVPIFTTKVCCATLLKNAYPAEEDCRNSRYEPAGTLSKTSVN